MTTVRQNIAHLVLNSIILLEIPPTTRTRTPSRATLTRWQRFRKKSGAKPSDCSAGWREVDARGQGHAADIHANHDPEEEEATEISSEIHPKIPKINEVFFYSATFEIEFVVHLASLQFLPARFQMLSQILPIVYDATRKKR